MTATRSVLLLVPALFLVLAAPLFAKDPPKTTTLNLSSPVLVHNNEIPALYTCDGDDVNPPLVIHGVPKDAKSLALIMDDPDAPAGVWVHWLVWNIDPATSQIPRATIPVGGRQGLNSWHKVGYRGPCPPSGTHRYYFRLYALKERLSLSKRATREELDRAMQGKIIESSELVATYGRK